MPLAELVRTIAALAVTLGLIGLAAVAARRFGPETLKRLQAARGRTRRLAVVESLMLDPQRRLVLVRVDDREQLLLLGEGSLLTPSTAPARFSSEIMKAGVTTRSGVSRACLGFSILDRRTNRARSSWLTWLSMNFFTGAAEASKAWGSSIFLSSSGLIPAS